MDSEHVLNTSSESRVDAQSLAELFHLVRSLIPEDQAIVVARPEMTVAEAIELMQRHNYSQLPVVAGQAVLGVFSFRSLTTKLLKMGKISEDFGNLAVDEFIEKFKFAQLSDDWDSIIIHLDKDDGVLVGHQDDLVGILTPMDVVSYLRDIANPFVLLAEIELSLRRIVGECLSEDELRTCAERCLTGKYTHDDMPAQLSEMTFNDYIQIVGDGRNWPHFEVAFGTGDWLRKRTAKRLKEVRDLRNDVFHFKRKLLAEDIDTLKMHRGWLQMKTRAFEAKRQERVTAGIDIEALAPKDYLRQLPEPPSIFKGRRPELDELATAVREGGVCSVRGLGGIGKTALALKLGQALAADYPDAQIFVDLRGTSLALAPGDAMAHVIHAFRPRAELPQSETERAGLYRSVLHGKRALLLLDDAADADQVRPLLPPASCALVMTSRQRFRLPGMYVVDLGALGQEEARSLLCELAPRIGDPQCARAGEIAQLCGHLPLALQMAAGALVERVDLNPADYARRLQDEQERLDLVDASLSLSHELLEQRLQRLWTRLSVFSIPFEHEAAAAVSETDPGATLDDLGTLLRYSLIDWREKVGRYAFHELARIFAYRKLEEMEDPRPVHRLAASYLETKLAGGEPGLAAEELLEVVDQWEEGEAWERFAQRSDALVGSLDRLGYWEEIEERLERALSAVEEHLNAPKLEATLLRRLGTIAWKQARWDRAIEMYEQSLEIFDSLGDARAIGQTFNNLALVFVDKGEWDQALEYHQRRLEIAEGLGDVHGMAQTLGNLGVVYARKGEWDQAIRYYQRGLETSERVGDLPGMADTLSNLGSVHADKGELNRAMEMYEQGLEVFDRLGDVHGMAKTFNNLGTVYYQQGEWDRAIEMFEQSLETKERIGDVHGMAQTFLNLGSISASKGELDRALEMYEESLKVFDRLGNERGIAQTWANQGGVYYRQGVWNSAIEMYEQSLEIYERLGDESGMAQMRSQLGVVHAEKGERDRAVELFEQSLRAFERLGDEHGIARELGHLGNAYHRQGDWDRAIELYEQSLGIAEGLGDVRGAAQMWGNLGNAYADKGEWDRAIEMYKRSLGIFERLGDLHGVAQTWSNLGNVYANKGDWDQAADLYEQSLQTFDRLGEIRGVAQTSINLGNVYADKGEWDRAMGLYEQSLQAFDRLGDAGGVAQAYNNLGNVYAHKREWDRAIEMYEQSLETEERLGSVRGVAETQGNLGLAYAAIGELDWALEMYEESLRIFDRLGDLRNMAKTWGALAGVYYQQGELDRATTMYEQSLEIFDRLGDVHGTANIWGGLGCVYYERREWDRAIEAYEQSLKTFQRLGDVHGVGQMLSNLGTVRLEKGELDRAIEMYKRTLEISKRLGDVHGIVQAHHNLGRAHSRKEDWNRATEHYDDAIELIPKDTSAYYNRACAYARLNQADAALKSLAKAIEMDGGYREAAKEDEDFDGLRGDERFEAVIGSGVRQK